MNELFHLSPMIAGIAILAVLISWVHVAAKAFGTLNITHGNYGWIPFSAVAIALAECTLIITVVSNPNVFIALGMGVGGTLGCFTSMYLHRRFIKR